jgi:hypothetical protein
MRAHLICAAAVAMIALAPCQARACGRGTSSGGSGISVLDLMTSVVGVADAGLTIWDLATVSGLRPPSAAYGTIELVLTVPQLLLGVAGLRAGGQNTAFFAGYTLWMAGLSAHGIWSISAALSQAPGAAPDPGPPPGPSGGTKMMLGPTYVPLGPLAQVGFGLSGRF